VYENIVKHILISLRGKQDRLALSKKLGYSYNQYSKFEGGYKKVYLPDFIKICELNENIDLLFICNKVLNLNLVEVTSDSILDAYTDVWGSPSSYILSNNLEMSDSKWWRIKNGKSPISLIDFFKLVNTTSVGLVNFLKYFLAENIINEVFKDKLNPSDVMPLLGKNPECALIMNAIFHNDYVASSITKRMAVLKSITKLTDDKLDETVSNLLEKNVCYVDELGFLKANYYKAEGRDSDLKDSRLLQRYVLEKILEENNNPDLVESAQRLRSGYKIICVSKQTKMDIRKALQENYLKICELIEHESGETDYEELLIYSQCLLTI
jgi:hypothetical protein